MLGLDPPPYTNHLSGPPPDYTSGAHISHNTGPAHVQSSVVSVELDSPDTVCNIGDIITGKVVITPKSDLKVKSVIVVLQGDEIASRSQWTTICSSRAYNRKSIKIDSFKLPASSFPDDAILRQDYTYSYPFSLQIQPQRAKSSCKCNLSHFTVPPSFSHPLVTNTPFGVGVGSGMSHSGRSSLQTPSNYEFLSAAADLPNKLSSTSGPKIGISYRVSANLAHSRGDRGFLLTNDSLYDQSTVTLMASYLPTPADNVRYSINSKMPRAANKLAYLDILPGNKMILSLCPKEKLPIRMRLSYRNHSANHIKSYAPSPRNISSKLICKTTYSTKHLSSTSSATEKPVEFAVNLQQEWLSVDDPNETNDPSTPFTSMTVGFSIPESVANSKLIVPTFKSCLIKREYFLKMRVRTTDPNSDPLDISVPVYLITSLSTPLSASSVNIDLEEAFAYMSLGLSHPTLFPQLAASSQRRPNPASVDSPSSSPLPAPTQNVLSSLFLSHGERHLANRSPSSRSPRHIFRNINSTINEMFPGSLSNESQNQPHQHDSINKNPQKCIYV